MQRRPARTIVPGGRSRSASVSNALAAVPEATVVVVHDAARPLATPELFDRCLGQLEALGCDGAIAGAAATDTIKEAEAGGRVTATLDRPGCGRFRPRRHSGPRRFEARSPPASSTAPTTTSQLVEAAGGDVRVIESTPDNIKVTTTTDLRVAELLLAGRRA